MIAQTDRLSLRRFTIDDLPLLVELNLELRLTVSMLEQRSHLDAACVLIGRQEQGARRRRFPRRLEVAFHPKGGRGPQICDL